MQHVCLLVPNKYPKLVHLLVKVEASWGGRENPYNGLYREAPPDRGTVFRLHVYERLGISLAEVYETIGKSVISVSKKAQKD